MKLLSLDASTKSTGYAIIENDKILKYGCITASGTDSLKRIKKMSMEIQKIAKEYEIDQVVCEEVLPSDVRNNQKTFKALMYNQAGIALALHDLGLKMNFVVASHWRKICGITVGAGVKRETLKKKAMDLVEKEFGIKVNDDVSDAICIGYAYINEDNQKLVKKIVLEDGFEIGE